MKYSWLMIFFIVTGQTLRGQVPAGQAEGTVSFLSSQNVYVKFKSTGNISIGDTLFFRQGDQLIPVLKVKYLSSISCACVPISAIQLNLSDKLICKEKQTKTSKTEKILLQDSVKSIMQPRDSLPDQKIIPFQTRQEISGYISAASYSMFSDTPSGNSQKMQYTLSLKARHIGNSNLSIENYMSFYHKNKAWSEVTKNIFNGLKIYSLALNYEFSKRMNLLIGRKINPMISNMGAVDGLQFGMKFRPFTLGLLAGSRPDYKDYSINFNLLQFGGYISHELSTKNGPVQSTLAFIEQTNAGNTDRRFVYLQHSNAVIPNLNFFGSVEFDLYKKTLIPIDTLITQDSTYQVDNSPRISNLYFSLRYRFSRKFSLSLSYSARQNVIYYETYKNFVDRLLQAETRQGYFCNLNYRPVNKLSLGATAGYNFQKNDPASSRNLNTYITYSQVPLLEISATLTATLLETSYLSGKIFRLDISRDIVPGKLSGGLNYSYVDYRFYNSGSALPQNIGELNLIWKIYRKLSLSLYLEGTFEKQNNYNRLYVQLNKRF